jgi:TPR repeat protein
VGTEDNKRAIAMIAIKLSHLERSTSQLRLREAAFFQKFTADRGDATAQCEHGIHVYHGRGVSVNHVEAARYFKLSADQGHPSGQCMYGFCLCYGRRVSMNHVEAARYFKLSADQGYADGQCMDEYVFVKVEVFQ